MRKISVTILLILLILLSFQAFTQVNKTIYDQLQKPAEVVYYHVPVGLCEDYPEETTTMDIIKKDFEFLKQNQVKFMRISFGWDAIEQEKDKYDWLFWDDFVRMAVDDYGITLIPYICYTPQWISSGANDIMNFWSYPPLDYEQFGLFMKALVGRYKGRIKTWELWNEPDISIYWKGSTADFAKLTKIGAKAVREADPEAKVVLAGIAYNPSFILELFRDHGVSPYVDIVNMHNYYETWHRHPVESIVEYVNEVYEVVWRYGDGQSLWMAEVGYSTFRQGSTVSSSYSAYYDYEHTPAYQAVDLFKRLSLVASTEKIAAIAWYELKDLPPAEEVIGDEYNNRYLGVAYIDHSPKPATKALVFFNSLFSGKYKNISNEVIVERTIDSDSHCLIFENENGSVIIVSWLQTNVPGHNPLDKDGAARDQRRENLKLRIPRKLQGKATIYNELGEGWKYDKVKTKKDVINLDELSLEGGKISIIKIEK
ncbi:MAG: hypothetical protein A2Y94_11850 [Caldithrix sp. RBG_13_44_9]|nr:MAG: hypothetical protein A2Y94_11850 [Caldithrix sp. RBG_13_44_9]